MPAIIKTVLMPVALAFALCALHALGETGSGESQIFAVNTVPEPTALMIIAVLALCAMKRRHIQGNIR